jgi:phosphate/sulfate permease
MSANVAQAIGWALSFGLLALFGWWGIVPIIGLAIAMFLIAWWRERSMPVIYPAPQKPPQLH